MAMCCMKCAEIISEELREVPGEHDTDIIDNDHYPCLFGGVDYLHGMLT